MLRVWFPPAKRFGYINACRRLLSAAPLQALARTQGGRGADTIKAGALLARQIMFINDQVIYGNRDFVEWQRQEGAWFLGWSSWVTVRIFCDAEQLKRDVLRMLCGA